MSPSQRPTESNAQEAAATFLGHESFTLNRYPTGLCHYVFEVVPDSGPKVVVRMGHEDTRKNLEGSVFWDRELTPLKLLTARILHHDLVAEFPYTILEHIQGTDLGQLYSSLTPSVRRQIAHSLVEIQSRVATLPRAQGFGYGFSFSDPRLRGSWRAILDDQLDRARQWIRSVGVASESHVERVSRELTKIRGYLDDVAPTPFLHDTTTKNVLVTESGLAGIVDIDDLCFGDPLYVLSLTYMALLSSRSSTDYVDFWSNAWELTSLQRTVMRIYTAIHCVGFMGEVGQRFNKDVVEIDHARLRYLEGILDDLLT
jgi:hypothetical protein